MNIHLTKGAPISAEAIHQLETDLGLALPAPYKTFLLENGAATPDSNIFPVGADNNDGIRYFLPVAEILANRANMQPLPDGALPIAECECGNALVLHLGDHGAIYHWDHELENGLTRLAASFPEFLDLLEPLDHDAIDRALYKDATVWKHPDFDKLFKDPSTAATPPRPSILKRLFGR